MNCDDLLDALRMCAPEEIRTYQKIIHNRDQILAKANAEAEQIRSQAQQETAQLLKKVIWYRVRMRRQSRLWRRHRVRQNRF